MKKFLMRIALVSTAEVGSSFGADGYWANGLIDEVMVFDRALSEEDVRQIYDAQK